MLISLDKYLAIRRRPISGDWQPPLRKAHDSNRIQLLFNPKASFRIKRVLKHILSGYILELIATGIFYEFLNIFQILRIVREQNIVKFQRPKITSDTWFQTKKDIPH